MTVPAKTTVTPGELMESVLLKGDLAKLTPDERTQYYFEVCKTMGLNPTTRPFEYINLKGKLVLYAKRDCADQLRKLNGISVQIVSQDRHDDLLSVHVRAVDKEMRTDEDVGVIFFPETLKGEDRANAIMKGVTKAKRRVTLSISGLGFLDETDIDEIPVSAKRPTVAPNPMRPAPVPTGEGAILPPPTNPPTAAATESGAPPDRGAPDPADVEAMAREAAERGAGVFNTYYKTLTPNQQAALLPLQHELRKLMEQHKKEHPNAAT